MKNSKFYRKTPLKERLIDSAKSLLFWKSRKKGMIRTRDIKWEDIKDIFFPDTFFKKYSYLGCVPYNELGEIFEAMEPLVIFMDYKAKPKFCPRWFLRFLHVFGSDMSIVRVRNRTLHNLLNKLTKGYTIYDYKTKWTHYDLRISIVGTKQMQYLADSIESYFYFVGYEKDLVEQIKSLDPNTKYKLGYGVTALKQELDRLLDIKDNQ
jgi:hypothetical protein